MVEALSGFPEWLPEQELVQQHVLRVVREQFELHGFTPLHTRSLERVDDLLSQGETDKEIYGVHRLAAGGRDGEAASLALHYDLTVPFARYVAEHRAQLAFPFRRYQVQPAWRGERPQLGRYREFLQADADVIANGTLDIRFDSEMLRLLQCTIDRLPVPRVKLLVNNRKVLEGYYRGLGIEDITATLRTIDKLAKIGEAKVASALVAAGLTAKQAELAIELSRLELAGEEELSKVDALGVRHALLDEGRAELARVLRDCNATGSATRVVGALHVARGLDYYTGTVVEGVLDEHRELGAVCSGGRYDNLASKSGGTPLPGVGVSLGITRLMAFCFHLGLLGQKRRTVALVVVAVHSDETRSVSEATAATLRGRGIPCLVSDSAAAYGKQIKAASQLGVPYIWFPANAGSKDEVKDLRSGEQTAVEPMTWRPAADAASVVTAV